MKTKNVVPVSFDPTPYLWADGVSRDVTLYHIPDFSDPQSFNDVGLCGRKIRDNACSSTIMISQGYLWIPSAVCGRCVKAVGKTESVVYDDYGLFECPDTKLDCKASRSLCYFHDWVDTRIVA